MQRFLFSFLVAFPLLFFMPDTNRNKDHQGPVPEGISRWSGTVTCEKTITYSNAAYNGTTEIHGKASFLDALPTMYRNDETTDLDFTDDKGTGSHKVHSEVTDITGKKCVGDCEGTGRSELHSVVINEIENTYDIEVEFPNCVGTGNCKNDGIFEGDPLSVIVSDQPLGTSKDILAGSKTVTADLPGGFGTATSTFTWHLVRSPEDDVELIVKPEGTEAGYEKWLPEPGRNELSKGTVMNIFLELQGKNGKPLKEKVESFELTLSNTSTEPGITINYPVTPDAKQLPDLRFLYHPGIESIEADQSISVGSPDGTTGKALIASYDGGGYTTLSVEAILKGSKRHIKGHLFASGGEQAIRIPKRDPLSHIAKSWLAQYKNPDEMDDEEKSKDNSNNGDGLSAYEEYRGVICQDKFGKTNPNNFGRLDPGKKELGVKMDRTEMPLFSEGLNWFENGSGLTVIRFNETEIGGDRRMNKNASTAHIYDQFAIPLYKGLLAYMKEQPLGITFTTTNEPEIPANTLRIVMDLDQIQNEYNEWLALARPASLPFTAAELLANTVAHELGHGVHIGHHGQIEDEPSPQTATAPDKSPYRTYRVFDRNGTEITTRPYPLDKKIGKGSGLESGDLSCVMVYNPYYNWSYTVGADHAKIFNQVPLTALGRKMCNSNSGTGFNHSIIFFGDAGNGNCLSQIKLKP